MFIKPSKEHPLCILAAMQKEAEGLLEKMQIEKTEAVSGITFYVGQLGRVPCVLAVCGVGKVFAALAAEAMILKYSPSLLINTGVAGSLSDKLSIGDIAVATELCQHDMDTSPLGDPVGLISGINRIFFPADEEALSLFGEALQECKLNFTFGRIASGDAFIASKERKAYIASTFGATCCEMEGAAIAQVAFVNQTPFCVLRAISDSADGSAETDYPTFCRTAAQNSVAVLLKFIENCERRKA